MSPDSPKSLDEVSIAHHEAGHAVVARLLGVEVCSAAIRSADGSLGYVRYANLPTDDQFASESERQAAYEHRAMICAAGGLAERRYRMVSDDEIEGHVGSLEDLNCATELVKVLVGEDEPLILERLNILDSRVRALLEANWRLVEQVAARLVERKALTGAEIDECIASAGGA